MNNSENARRDTATGDHRELVFKHGHSANSFVTLNRGFQRFDVIVGGEKGAIAYVSTPTAWVAGAEPFISAEHQMKALKIFSEAARAEGKSALILPVSRNLALFARAAGLSVFEVGREPWLKIDDKRYKSDFLQLVPAAKQLKGKGAKVEEFLPSALAADEHAELKEISQRWLDDQNAEPLGFLNRLDPWSFMNSKKYFRLVYEGQQVAFLAAVPVPARKAWYLIDLIRDPEAPVGSTELLVIEATEMLTRQGAVEVTLGMAPLVPVDDKERTYHPLAYKIMRFIFEKTSSFYGFKSLFAYKEKFLPQSWEPVYLIALSGPVNLKMLYGLVIAHYPKGLLSTTFKTLARKIAHIHVSETVSMPFGNNVALRSVPNGLLQILGRMRATLSIIFINALFYILTVDRTGHLRWHIYEKYGYSWSQLTGPSSLLNKVLLFIMPAVLHSHPTQFMFNTATMFVFVGMIEVVMGTTNMTTFYLVGAVVSNILATALIAPLLFLLNREALDYFLYSPDVGCSLGVLSCAGAYIYISKYRRLFSTVIVLTTIAGAIATGEVMFFNHLVAAMVGFGLASVVFK